MIVENYGWQTSVVDGSRWVGEFPTNKDANTTSLNVWDRALNGMLKDSAVPSWGALGFAKLDVTPGDTLRARFSEKQWWMERAAVSQVSPCSPFSPGAARTGLHVELTHTSSSRHTGRGRHHSSSRW